MEPTLFELLGGAEGVRRLVERFYHHMDTDPASKRIRDMHPADLNESIDKLTLFLTMWSGGPRTYVEQRGHPRLRARHLPFPIDDAAAMSWLACMEKALEECVDDAHLRGDLMGNFHRIALHMRNQ